MDSQDSGANVRFQKWLDDEETGQLSAYILDISILIINTCPSLYIVSMIMLDILSRDNML